MKFQAWAKETKTQSRRCKVCQLPEELLTEVKAARKAGYGSTIIQKFLEAAGHAVSGSSIENHLKGGH